MNISEIVISLKKMADSDGVVSLKKDSKERYYLSKLVGVNDGLKIAEWVKENTGLMMYVKGKNDTQIIYHRLNKHGFIKEMTIDGVKVKRLYAEDLIARETDNSVVATIKDSLRKQIKEQASRRHCSAGEYVEENMHIEYVPKNKVALRNFHDVNDWINKNIKNNDADSLRRVDGFANVRDWLGRNWEIKNPEIVSAFVDYVVENFKQYTVSGTIDVVDKRAVFYNMLEKMYPDKLVVDLKKSNPKLYHAIYSYRREVPKGHLMSMKDMIEKYIGNDEFVYASGIPVRVTKYTSDYIIARLAKLYGNGNTKAPVKTNIRKDDRVLYQGIRTFCKGNEITIEDFMAGLGYEQYNKLNKNKVVKKPTNKVRVPKGSKCLYVKSVEKISGKAF